MNMNLLGTLLGLALFASPPWGFHAVPAPPIPQDHQVALAHSPNGTPVPVFALPHGRHEQPADEDAATWLEHILTQSARPDMEVCSWIYTNTQTHRLAVDMVTAHSALFCVAPQALEWPGHERSTASAHTHPNLRFTAPTALDKEVFPNLDDVVWLDNTKPSPEDLASGPMWLLSSDGVLWHANGQDDPKPHVHRLFPKPRL